MKNDKKVESTVSDTINSVEDVLKFKSELIALNPDKKTSVFDAINSDIYGQLLSVNNILQGAGYRGTAKVFNVNNDQFNLGIYIENFAQEDPEGAFKALDNIRQLEPLKVVLTEASAFDNERVRYSHEELFDQYQRGLILRG